MTYLKTPKKKMLKVSFIHKVIMVHINQNPELEILKLCHFKELDYVTYEPQAVLRFHINE